MKHRKSLTKVSYQTFAALVIEPIKDVSERIGGSATFKCKLPYEGAPVEWIHNGIQIFPDKNPEKYEIITDGLFKVLVIKNLKEDEQGTFGVKIANNLCTAKLQVQGVYCYCVSVCSSAPP